jgi:hypothetical protein
MSKILTGAYPLNTVFANACTVSNYDYGNLVSQYTIYGVQTPDDCYAINSSSSTTSTEGSPIYNTSNITLPSDGVVLSSSAQAFPGAGTILMNGSNHQQMRNDENTKTVLNTIYNGTNITLDQWFITSPR